MERRAFLRVMAALAAAGLLPRSRWRGAKAIAADGPYGPLGPADANGIMLPAGFTSREVARGGSVVGTTGYVWPPFPDGGAVFRAPGGWIYVANSERNAPSGAWGPDRSRSGTSPGARWRPSSTSRASGPSPPRSASSRGASGSCT